MAGCVARYKGGLGFDSFDLQFMMEKKRSMKEKKFESREDCIRFFREVEHYATDDIKYLIWFEDENPDDENCGKPRSLLTGEIIELKHEKWFPF